jgi:hypothetical protein
MFWARSAALRPVLDLRLRTRDFPPEAGQIDGTTAHERLLLYACEHAGFSWLKIANPSLFEDRATIVPIQSSADLDAFMHTHCFSLLPVPRRTAPTGSMPNLPRRFTQASQCAEHP